MRQLTYTKPRTLRFWDVPEPVLHAEGEALVRPFVAARCDGDSMFLRYDFECWLRIGARVHVVDHAFSHARDDVFHGPFPYGHECVAEVLSVGNDVRTVRPGDVVVVPWSVSCGHCGCCSRGMTAKCERAQTPLAAYGFSAAMGEHGGMVSDVVRVPYADAMLVPVPQCVDPIAAASVSDNMTDAYRAVGPLLAEQPGAPVLIVGGAAHSIGLYAAAIAVALGSSRVVYLDGKRERLEAAERVGAYPIELSWRDRWFHRGKPVCSEGFPISVDASGSVSGLNYALHALAPGGTCTALAFYLFNYTPLSLWQPYLSTCTLRIGVAHARPHVPAVLDLLERRAFDPLAIKPVIGSWSDAERVLLEPATKVIVQRPKLERLLRQPAVEITA
jgi:threonine dehydrogenase-like Zn-dependent dehydrogenase